jgi:hypothetical protein
MPPLHRESTASPRRLVPERSTHRDEAAPARRPDAAAANEFLFAPNSAFEVL